MIKDKWMAKDELIFVVVVLALVLVFGIAVGAGLAKMGVV